MNKSPVTQKRNEGAELKVRGLTDAEGFGSAIRKRREYLGLKVYELAKKVGINPVYITQIEKHDKLPSASIMKKIADVLRDQGLFNIYIKIKYPALQEIVGKGLDSLEEELLELENEFKREDLSPQEKSALVKRLADFNARLHKSYKKLREMMKSDSKLRTRFLAGK